MDYFYNVRDKKYRLKDYKVTIPRINNKLHEKDKANNYYKFLSYKKEVLNSFIQKNLIEKLKDKNFLIVGGTGSGIGYSIAISLLSILEKGSGSLIILSKDLKNSFEYETAILLQMKAEKKGVPFFWNNKGISLKDNFIDNMISNLNFICKKKSLIYINTIAAAIPGLLEGYPNIYIKDYDENGIFQWKLPVLTLDQINRTKSIMGDWSVKFPKILQKEGWDIELVLFSDWRGSLDKNSQNPNKKEYGRQGAYSGSLYLPKNIIQRAVYNEYKKGNNWINIFYPVMNTRALRYIPGGFMMYQIFCTLMIQNQMKYPTKSFLGIKVLQIIQSALNGCTSPFLHLDFDEILLLKRYHEVLLLMNNQKNSQFYYKKWINMYEM